MEIASLLIYFEQSHQEQNLLFLSFIEKWYSQLVISLSLNPYFLPSILSNFFKIWVLLEEEKKGLIIFFCEANNLGLRVWATSKKWMLSAFAIKSSFTGSWSSAEKSTKKSWSTSVKGTRFQTLSPTRNRNRTSPRSRLSFALHWQASLCCLWTASRQSWVSKFLIGWIKLELERFLNLPISKFNFKSEL